MHSGVSILIRDPCTHILYEMLSDNIINGWSINEYK